MDTSKKKNKKGRTKVFKSCFKPAVDCDDHAPPPESFHKSSEKALGKPVLIAVNGKGKLLLSDGSSVVPASTDGKELVCAGIGYDAKRSSSSRRRISRIFKAVLFDTAVSKKIRKKKSSKNSNDSDVNNLSSLSSERFRDAYDEKNLNGGEESSDADDSSSHRSNIFSSSSRTASSTYSNSCCSSMSSNSRSLSDRKGSSRINSLDRKLSLSSNLLLPRHSHGKRVSGFQLNTGLCLFLLLSLLVLVVWGRICAIFCTSIWLYLGTYRRVVYHVVSTANAADSSDTESEHYKKRVIMEGLLRRNRDQGR